MEGYAVTVGFFLRVRSHAVMLSGSHANTIKCTPCRGFVLLLISVIFCNGAGGVGNYIVREREMCSVLMNVNNWMKGLWSGLIWLRL